MNINYLHKNAENGDSAAEKELFENLSERFRLILQHKVMDKNDAEDILQDTLMMISSKYKTIEFTSSFSAWAHKVLTNNILHYYRSKGLKDKRFIELDHSEIARLSWNPDPNVEMRLLDCLKQLNRVNRRHARILNLHFQGYSKDNICKKLNLSQNNIYLVLYRARSMLRLCLDKGEIK